METVIVKISKILKLTNSPEPHEASSAALKAMELMEAHGVSIDEFHDYNHPLVKALLPKKKGRKKTTGKTQKKPNYVPVTVVESPTHVRSCTAGAKDLFSYLQQRLCKIHNSSGELSESEHLELKRRVNEVWVWQWFHYSIYRGFSNHIKLRGECSRNYMQQFRYSKNILKSQTATFTIDNYTENFLKLSIQKMGNKKFKIVVFADRGSVLTEHKLSKFYFPLYRKEHEFYLENDFIPQNVYKFIFETVFSVEDNYWLYEDIKDYDVHEDVTIDTNIKNKTFDLKEAMDF